MNIIRKRWLARIAAKEAERKAKLGEQPALVQEEVVTSKKEEVPKKTASKKVKKSK